MKWERSLGISPFSPCLLGGSPEEERGYLCREDKLQDGPKYPKGLSGDRCAGLGLAAPGAGSPKVAGVQKEGVRPEPGCSSPRWESHKGQQRSQTFSSPSRGPAACVLGTASLLQMCSLQSSSLTSYLV